MSYKSKRLQSLDYILSYNNGTDKALNRKWFYTIKLPRFTKAIPIYVLKFCNTGREDLLFISYNNLYFDQDSRTSEKTSTVTKEDKNKDKLKALVKVSGSNW